MGVRVVIVCIVMFTIYYNSKLVIFLMGNLKSFLKPPTDLVLHKGVSVAV